MEKLTKGCVYFIKHKGLTPIKIGYSISESPYDRLKQLKIFAPYGAELLGFIITDRPNSLERELHKKFEAFRLEGEWFSISIEQVDETIKLYSIDDDLDKRSKFEIAYSKFLFKELTNDTDLKSELYPLYLYDIGIKNSFDSKFIPIVDIAKIISESLNKEISIQNLSILMKKLGFPMDRKTINNHNCRGFWVIEKQQ